MPPPRPIGTERAWKNYTGMASNVCEPEVTHGSWLWTGGNNLDRHQLYRNQGSTPAFARIMHDEVPTIIDTTAYQVMLDNNNSVFVMLHNRLRLITMQR